MALPDKYKRGSDNKQIVVMGNPVNGFVYYGPFDSKEEAIDYAEQDGGDWWIAPVLEPV